MNLYFKRYENCIIALSGGSDSAVIAKLAAEHLGAENVLAVTFEAPHIFWYQTENARKLARHLDIKWENRKLPVDDAEILAGTPERCYLCKRAMMHALTELAIERGYDAVFDGTNIDDTSEHRPGLKALEEYGIRSPLLENNLGDQFVIEEAAKIAEEADLSFHDESCIATRVEGMADIPMLRRIEREEDALRERFPGIRLKTGENGTFVRFKKPMALKLDDFTDIGDALERIKG
ncbi:potassium-transporting ATPase subunit A [Limisalsivibrio acetivorans]|uniref:potassium-transporting ATPase subunit A n=1 Tax=Limisalsivibrio acetivorans TaxID=1304888 RepID=UPI0003B69758|nr:potassium-transporting ATPase subunit A [Limisalsivibrio acetivorans]